LKLPRRAWDVANIFWAVYMVCLALANFLVAALCSTEVWVNFKIFGALLATAVVALCQVGCLGMVPPKEHYIDDEDVDIPLRERERSPSNRQEADSRREDDQGDEEEEGFASGGGGSKGDRADAGDTERLLSKV